MKLGITLRKWLFGTKEVQFRRDGAIEEAFVALMW